MESRGSSAKAGDPAPSPGRPWMRAARGSSKALGWYATSRHRDADGGALPGALLQVDPDLLLLAGADAEIALNRLAGLHAGDAQRVQPLQHVERRQRRDPDRLA